MDEKGKVSKGLTPEEIQVLRSKRKQDLTNLEQIELKASLSVQERLERKFETDIVEVVMKDDLDNFSVKFKKLSPVQQEELGILVSTDLTAKTAEEKEALNDKLYELLEFASLDGIKAEFWKNKTGYSTGDFVTIITRLASASALPDQKYMEEINKFRR